MAFERSIEHWKALPFLSVKEAAAVLGLGDKSVRKLIEDSELEARTVCGKTMVLVPSIQRFARQETGDAAPVAPTLLSATERKIVRELRGGVAS
jgi:excisionase family DNA binding protein